jgi:CubicO group peptidase (beta-lactamase class C family)
VRDALAHNFRVHGEIGAAVAATIDGRAVVDLWAGWMDAARTRPWQQDTLVDVFSAGKAMAAVSLLMLVEGGRIDLDAPVARYWPEFAAAGKGAVTVRTEPGTQHGYHVNTFGFLIGELVRRASGTDFGDFFRREISGPLGADFHFGIGAEHDARIADYLFGDPSQEMRADALRNDPALQFLLYRTYANPDGISGNGTVNTRAWRTAVIPSTNGHASARALARIYSALACPGGIDGVTLLGTAMRDEATREASAGVDAVLRRPSRFGLGFQLTQPERPLGPNARSFGHFGAGGALGFADPEARLSFGYVLNNAGPRWQNPRNRALIDAVYASL